MPEDESTGAACEELPATRAVCDRRLIRSIAAKRSVLVSASKSSSSSFAFCVWADETDTDA